jgi:hypothetical protein
MPLPLTILDPYLTELVNELAQQQEVDAIALGGSHTLSMNDDLSDFDLYVYLNAPLSVKRRKQITDKHCQSMELNQQFWENEDDGVLKSGVEVEIIYRTLEGIEQGLDSLINQLNVSLGYSTCFWANLLHCHVLFESDQQLSRLKSRYGLPYPQALATAIIKLNLPLLCDAFPNYPKQIAKAVKRQDHFSVLHRTNEYLASYFDVLFALNHLPHPGEKRLVEFASLHCQQLPANFKESMSAILHSINASKTDLGANPLEDSINQATHNLLELINSSPNNLH